MFKPRQIHNLFLLLLVSSLLRAQDWADINHYREANQQLLAQAKNGQRVVFMGNSITESWQILHPRFFVEHGYVNRGISGQTTPQMLIRFRPDVITLQADVVVIMAGTNDIAGNTGSIRLTEILGNLISMAELARSHGIEVILCSVLPATSFSWVPELEPAPQIAQLNTMIQNYAQSQGITYLDYYAALVNEKMGLKKRYTRDGVHPNRAGYQVMEKLVQKHLSRYISDHP